MNGDLSAWQVAALQPVPVLARGGLHLWWWPEAAQPPIARRARVDHLLRRTLAGYVGLQPEALSLAREPKGRPFLRHALAPDFNLSDTRGGTLIGVCRGGRVGVDLEQAARALPALRLAHRYFSAAETAALAAVPATQLNRAFIFLWTAKEAACKATGTGIFGWLHRWRFAVGPAQPIPVEPLPGEASGSGPWSFLRLSPPGGFTAVAACHGFRPGPVRYLIGSETR